jgi:hypothetical protein
VVFEFGKIVEKPMLLANPPNKRTKYFYILFTKPYFLIPQVLIPNSVYKGQKLTKLVRVNTAAMAKKTIPTVPVIVSVK